MIALVYKMIGVVEVFVMFVKNEKLFLVSTMFTLFYHFPMVIT